LVEAKCNEDTLAKVLLVFQKIATRTAYLELLYENEGALKHLIKLCQESAWLSEYIAKYPILLDELIDPKLFNNPPALTDYASELRQLMLRIPEDDLEAQMDTLRQFKQAQQLRIAAGDIAGVLPLVKVSDHLTALAEAIIDEVINLAWWQVSQRFGIPSSLQGQQNKGFAAIGYGKLGGYELAYNSDLDLVFVHNSQTDDKTNGNKQILAGQFYVKLAQRIMHMFNTRMNSGILYELDMRLRPSGNAGVLMVHIDTFAQYQAEEAWTWEHQALVRARVVYGARPLQTKFNSIRQQILSLSRDVTHLQKDVSTMRDKMRTHLDKSSGEIFDVKQGPGGLVDIEFLVQFWVLAYSCQYPQIAKYSDNLHILQQLEDVGVITHQEQILLSQAYCQLRDFGHRCALQMQSLPATDELKALSVAVASIYQRYLG
jgi:glutamate-ammonia-ligase adenylyltransferase